MRVMQVHRWFLALVAVALVAVALVAAACADDPSLEGGGTTLSLPQSPTALPDTDLGSYSALLESLRGTPVVVNVWASWCGPCRLEAPALAEVATAYDGRVQFVGLDVLDTRPDARAFIQEFAWPYPSLFDRTGAIRDHLGFIGQPVTIFYDAEGALVNSHIGSITREQLEAQVDALRATS